MERELERMNLSDSCRDFSVGVGNEVVLIVGALQGMKCGWDLWTMMLPEGVANR